MDAIIPNPELYALGNLSRNNIEFKFGNRYQCFILILFSIAFAGFGMEG
jgi:hypothetical protein